MRMLNRLEKRQLKYCFFVGWCKLSLFVFSWIYIQLNQHRPQGTSYRSEATLAFSSDNLLSECHLSFPLSCLLHLPTPTLEMFLNNIWFSVFFFFEVQLYFSADLSNSTYGFVLINSVDCTLYLICDVWPDPLYSSSTGRAERVNIFLWS